MRTPRNKRKRDRFWLAAAVVGLALSTLVVLTAVYLFFSSLAMMWEPLPALRAVAVLPTPAPLQATATAVAVDPLTQPEDASDERPLLMPHASSVRRAPSTETDEAAAADPSLGELIIPALGVSQPIAPVPIRDGTWDIDGLSTQIGHLQTTGTRPGDELAMTFIGHVTLPWPNTGPFANLVMLEHDEEIIYRWNGTDYVYRVERIFRADPRAVDLLYVPDGERIVLVTCSGWDFVERAYAQRLVTRAVFVRQEPSPQTSS